MVELLDSGRWHPGWIEVEPGAIPFGYTERTVLQLHARYAREYRAEIDGAFGDGLAIEPDAGDLGVAVDVGDFDPIGLAEALAQVEAEDRGSSPVRVATMSIRACLASLVIARCPAALGLLGTAIPAGFFPVVVRSRAGLSVHHREVPPQQPR
jgi:hypothetical protein